MNKVLKQHNFVTLTLYILFITISMERKKMEDEILRVARVTREDLRHLEEDDDLPDLDDQEWIDLEDLPF